MGKKGTWFSAIKTLFTSTPSHSNQEQEGKQKKGRFKLKHGSFFRGREPSSIEKILGEVDQQTILYHHPPQPQPNLSNSPPPRQIQIPHTHVSNSPPPRQIQIPQTHVSNSPRQIEIPQTQASYSYSPTPTRLVDAQIPPLQHLSATKIQAAYRGYMARKKRSRSRNLTSGVARLQSVVTGQHVKRQTVNAMKQMQLLVRLQTQIHSRRIQMNQQPLNKQQLLLSESEIDMGDEYSWDDSLITKEEREARLHRKAEALIKRQKAMAYAYSHQLWKAKPKSAQNSIQSGWWWSRLERHFPCDVKNRQFASTPSPSTSTSRPTTPRLIKKTSLSPMSTRSMVPPRTRQRMKYSIKDDDSLMSCPPFSSVPSYMSPTVSAKAKARPTSNPKDRMASTSSPCSERRLSFPSTPKSNSNGSVNWKKGSGSSTRKHKSPGSIGELSMDSAFSALGRKPFNRFV